MATYATIKDILGKTPKVGETIDVSEGRGTISQNIESVQTTPEGFTIVRLSPSIIASTGERQGGGQELAYYGDKGFVGQSGFQADPMDFSRSSIGTMGAIANLKYNVPSLPGYVAPPPQDRPVITGPRPGEPGAVLAPGTQPPIDQTPTFDPRFPGERLSPEEHQRRLAQLQQPQAQPQVLGVGGIQPKDAFGTGPEAERTRALLASPLGQPTPPQTPVVGQPNAVQGVPGGQVQPQQPQTVPGNLQQQIGGVQQQIAQKQKELTLAKQAEALGGKYVSPEEIQAESTQRQQTPQDIQAQQTLDTIQKNLGVSFNPSDFQLNPTKTVKELVKEVMEATGLPDASKQITDITTQIEDLENERNKKIADVNDNPWISEALRSRNVAKVQTEYEGKINARTNKLKLLQDVADDARQQAQFVATTAINLYDKDRNFRQDQLEFIINQAQETLKAQREARKPFELSPGQARFEFNPKTGKFEETARVAAKPESTPTSFQEYQLAGGLQGTGKTYAEYLTTTKPPTNAQFTVANYANRIEQAGQVFDELASAITPLLTSRTSLERNKPDRLKRSEVLQQEQAERNFVNAVLRRESGAVISPSEFENAAKQYFPMPGDTTTILVQKKANRDLVQRNFIAEAGNAYVPLGNTQGGTVPLTQPDGTQWRQNPDGSYTRIK